MTAEMIAGPVTPTEADVSKIRVLALRTRLTDSEFACVLAKLTVPGAVLSDGSWTRRDVAVRSWELHHPGRVRPMLDLAWEAVAVLSGQRDGLDARDIPVWADGDFG